MAACPPLGGDGVVPDILDSPSEFTQSNLNVDSNQGKSNIAEDNSGGAEIGCEKVYEKVATLEENELRNFLEEVVSQSKKKDDNISTIAQILLRKEEDALREESGSGEDTIELAFRRQRKKRLLSKRDPHYYCTHPTIVGSPAGCSPSHGSAASRATTGGSLGSLQDLTDQTNVPSEQTVTTTTASRSRGGGSCGNLSRGSFETQAPSKRRRRREGKRASTSQSEGGSLQNLSKTEAACHESKKLHKSGSLSHVFSDVGGVRVKTRRQKTSSESSSSRLMRRSEERDVEESSEEEVPDIPYMPLATSPQMALNPEVGHFSDGPSGETTEDESESLSHIAARSKLGNDSYGRHSHHIHHHHYSGHHSDNDSELHTIITHVAHRDVLPTISSDSEVDKPIKYGIVQEESLSPSPPILLPINTSNLIFDSIASKSISKDSDDIVEKRKLRSTKSEGGNIEKLDENGNPVLMSVKGSSSSHSSSISALQSCTDRHTNNIIPSITRRTGFSSSKDNMSTYNRLKAKQDKKKAIKEKDVMPSEKTPGYRGDASLDTLLKFLGAEDTSNSKMKKKQKKKEDVKDDLKRNKMRDKVEESKDKLKVEDDGNGNESYRERKSDDGLRQSSKKDRKRKNSGMRESLSIEDLVSKSKQNDNVKVKDFKKQVTLDDGAMNLCSDSSYKTDLQEDSSAVSVDESASEFTSEFYKIGDPMIETDILNGGASGTGDFQEVINRKRGRKNKYESVPSRIGSYGEALTNEDQKSHGTMRIGIDNRRSYHPPISKPHINFNEAPRTVHEGAFFSRWNGVSKSNNNSGGYGTTTSAPHSEDSDSDGGDSVHSMPAHTTPRSYIRRPPPSTNTPPPASYANITKLASANRSQVRCTNPSGQGSSNAIVPTPFTSPNASMSDQCEFDKGSSVEPEVNHSNNNSIASILDDNFPPLAESFLSPAPTESGNSGKPPDLNKSIDFKSFETNSSALATDSPHQKRDVDYLINSNSNRQNIESGNINFNHISGIKNSTYDYSDKCIFRNLSPPDYVSKGSIVSTSIPQDSTTFVKTPQVNSQQSSSISNKSLINSHNNSMCGSVNNSSVRDSNNSRINNRNPKDRMVTKQSCKVKENSIFVPNGGVRKKFEEAVIFTDNAKFNLSVSDIEFGFDLEAISNITDKKVSLKLSETAQRTSLQCVDNENSICNDIVSSAENNDANNSNNSQPKTDFSKMFLPPQNDSITYNYEELCRHLSKEWESTLKLLEEDPKNVGYWSASIEENV